MMPMSMANTIRRWKETNFNTIERGSVAMGLEEVFVGGMLATHEMSTER
jgi:hypothetical protein